MRFCLRERHDEPGRAVAGFVAHHSTKFYLAPNLVEHTFDIIRQIRAEGVTVIMVEQNAAAALELSDRSYVLEQSRVSLTGTGAALLDDPHVRQAYLGA